MESNQIICATVDDTLGRTGKGYLVNVLGAVFVWTPCLLIFASEFVKGVMSVTGLGHGYADVFLPLGLVVVCFVGIVSGVQTYHYSFATAQKYCIKRSTYANLLCVVFYSGSVRNIPVDNVSCIKKFKVNRMVCLSSLVSRDDDNYAVRLVGGKTIYFRGNVGDVECCMNLLQERIDGSEMFHGSSGSE